jgi:hypothetical protein
MLVSWDFGWLNSFNKGYEQAFTGPLTGILGALLFVLAMFYVPMAQAHQAATGEARAFFQFRFVWRLVRAKPTAYFGLALLISLFSVILDGLRLAVVSEDFPGNSAADPAEGLEYLYRYLLASAGALFVFLLAVRGLAAVIYRKAVLKALDLGWVMPDELHPTLARWLNHLEMLPMAPAVPTGFKQTIRVTSRWSYRRFVYAAIFLTWLVFFVARSYVGYFLVANGPLGFLNHPLVQFPCFDHVPWHLQTGTTSL